HRRVKQRIRPMLGFKRFDNAAITISGIELAEKIKKGQFKTGKFGPSEMDSVGSLECCTCRLTHCCHSLQQSQPTFGPDWSLHQSRKVDLPEPFGPKSARRSPDLIRNDVPCRAGTAS